MLDAALCVLRRDLLLAWRRRSDVATGAAVLRHRHQPLPARRRRRAEPAARIAPGVIWVAALLSSMLSLARLFAADHADGTLEQMLLGAAPLGVIAAAKAAAHWIVSGLPLALIAPLIACSTTCRRVSTGACTIIAAGHAGAQLDRRHRRGVDPRPAWRGILLSLLVLPLYVPVLILGAGSVDMASAGMGGEGSSCCWPRLLVAAGAFAPWAIAAALRISME
jgi:heme exporter protein B